MSRVNQAIHNDLQLLALARDEIKLQAHLLKADAKVRWDELERKWGELKSHVERAEVAAGGAEREVETAARLLADSLRAGYKQVRDALKG
jgi:hypothetical protein